MEQRIDSTHKNITTQKKDNQENWNKMMMVYLSYLFESQIKQKRKYKTRRKEHIAIEVINYVHLLFKIQETLNNKKGR